MTQSKNWRALCVLIAAAALCTPLTAKFANSTEPLPADRMIKNTEAWIKEKPNDPQGYYVLGRVHAMAWAYGPELTLIKPADDKSLPGFAAFQQVQVRRADKAATKEDIDHLASSLAAYAQAVNLDAKNALYALGYAWMLQEAGAHAGAELLGRYQLPQGFALAPETHKAYEQAMQDLASADPRVREAASATLQAGLPISWVVIGATGTSGDAEVKARVEAIVKGYWDVKALEAYRKAYELALPNDLKNRSQGPRANSQISGEAGQAILDILKSQPQAAKPNEARDVADNIVAMRGSMAITPIVFAMPGTPMPQRVGDLVDSSKRVSFDLAGDQVPRTWTWLKEGTALLVWDPGHTGHITNGRQLFGSRTWWIFFRNGYEALSILDDNRDGQLTGDELQGIAIWIDKNGDGISQPGELLTLEQAGITAIGVGAAPDADGTLANSAGIRFADGQTVKSFDWVTIPVDSESQQGK
jgi:hypothetical protein